VQFKILQIKQYTENIPESKIIREMKKDLTKNEINKIK
jgi:hypothetical protein